MLLDQLLFYFFKIGVCLSHLKWLILEITIEISHQKYNSYYHLYLYKILAFYLYLQLPIITFFNYPLLIWIKNKDFLDLGEYNQLEYYYDLNKINKSIHFQIFVNIFFSPNYLIIYHSSSYNNLSFYNLALSCQKSFTFIASSHLM